MMEEEERFECEEGGKGDELESSRSGNISRYGQNPFVRPLHYFVSNETDP